MEKEIEALENLFDLVTCQGSFEKAQKCYDILEEALTELKQIKEAEPSEALRKLDDISYLVLNEMDDLKNKELWISYFKTIKQALLKQLSGSQYTNIFIDEAVNPNEVMKAVEDIYRNGVFLDLNGQPRKYSWETNKSFNEQITLVKQYILKAQENEKDFLKREMQLLYEKNFLKEENDEYKEVLRIILEKNVDIEVLKYRLRVKDDDVYWHYKYDSIMTREEFDLLKRVL